MKIFRKINRRFQDFNTLNTVHLYVKRLINEMKEGSVDLTCLHVYPEGCAGFLWAPPHSPKPGIIG